MKTPIYILPILMVFLTSCYESVHCPVFEPQDVDAELFKQDLIILKNGNDTVIFKSNSFEINDEYEAAIGGLNGDNKCAPYLKVQFEDLQKNTIYLLYTIENDSLLISISIGFNHLNLNLDELSNSINCFDEGSISHPKNVNDFRKIKSVCLDGFMLSFFEDIEGNKFDIIGFKK